jgi:hypothetical protein
VFLHAMSDEDLERIIRHPAAMIASDGEVPILGRAVPHPRTYGTFARVLCVYVREKHLLTLEDAVRKMTAFPAARLGFDRSWRAQAGFEGGHRRLRSREGEGHGHVHAAAPVCRSGALRHRQRRTCVRERGDDCRAAWKGGVWGGQALTESSSVEVLFRYILQPWSNTDFS